MNAQEAIVLLKGISLDEALAAYHFGLEIYAKLANGKNILTAAALWNAGRVQGIREERAKRKQKHEH